MNNISLLNIIMVFFYMYIYIVILLLVLDIVCYTPLNLNKWYETERSIQSMTWFFKSRSLVSC